MVEESVQLSLFKAEVAAFDSGLAASDLAIRKDMASAIDAHASEEQRLLDLQARRPLVPEP